jgi:cell division control protein 24
MAEKDAEEQRFGALFVQNEEAFSVYEPYCSNYYSAQDLVVQETPKLQKLEHILNPIYQLPSMLIKPIQRICKYPLLQGELIKSTNKDWPHVAEMENGLNAIKRVTEKVNETQRQHENIQAVEDLKKRVDDWKVRKKHKNYTYFLHSLTDSLFCCCCCCCCCCCRESMWMDMVVYYFKKK